MELLLAPESWPFALSIIIVMLIGVIESVTLLIGFSLSGLIDHINLIDLDGWADSWLGWLHVGRVPMLVLLILFLTSFAFLGFAFIAVFHGMVGAFPSPLLSSGLSLLFTLPIVHVGGSAIARVIPKDETSAVELNSLVGHVAVIVNGTARLHYPAQARVRSEQGQTFYIHVEPDSENVVFVTGESVLLVKQLSGSKFSGIANPRPDLL